MKELQEHWNRVLRHKATQYEHKAREKGENVVSPSIDDICNEMNAFFTGLNFNNTYEKQNRRT